MPQQSHLHLSIRRHFPVIFEKMKSPNAKNKTPQQNNDASTLIIRNQDFVAISNDPRHRSLVDFGFAAGKSFEKHNIVYYKFLFHTADYLPSQHKSHTHIIRIIFIPTHEN